MSWRPQGGGPRVTVDWHGVDPELATGRTGIKRFDVQRRTELGAWTRVASDPDRSKVSFRSFAAGDQRVRIRAIDRDGNVGPWTYVSIDLPERRTGWVRV